MSDAPGDEPADPTTRHVRRAVDGDTASLEWMVLRFSPLLRAQAAYRLGPRLAGRIDADDVVAETWMVALGRLPEIEPRGDRLTPVLLAFLASTLRFVANNQIRSHLRHSGLAGAPEGGGPESGTAGGPLDRMPARVRDVLSQVGGQEVAREVLACIERLGADDRRLIVLRGIEGLPNQDIARQTGELPNTVSRRYRRAVARLRAWLPDSVFEELVDR